MKLLAHTLIILATLSLASRAEGALIVDTGTPNNTTGWSFYPSQYFAGEFSIAGTYQIQSVEGYLSNAFSPSAGTVTVAIWTDGGNTPGTTLFSSTFALAASAPLAWYGVSGLNQPLAPGTYWVSFTPSSSIFGTMPCCAPNPLGEYDQNLNPAGWQDHGPNAYDYLDLGIRINAEPVAAVPEPAFLVLFSAGLVSAGVRRRLIATGATK
jgi:hypothetical protein